jgi:hypothetical protein
MDNNEQRAAFPLKNEAKGFTKLEYASLLMMQGLMDSADWDMARNEKADDLAGRTAKTAVLMAKAVLEEANK